MSDCKEFHKFLDLPAELRVNLYDFTRSTYDVSRYVRGKPENLVDDTDNDMEGDLYDDLSDDGHVVFLKDWDEPSNVYSLRTINPHLLQASKLVKQEADNLIPKSTTFIFEEWDSTSYEWILADKFPASMVSKIQHAVFKVNAWCTKSSCHTHHLCAAKYDIKSSRLYAEAMAETLPELRSCELGVNIVCPDHDKAAWPTIEHAPVIIKSIKKLANIEKVTGIQVYKVCSNSQRSSAKEMMWVCWNKEHGWHTPSSQDLAKWKVDT